jgi:predicted lipid-binding transport protein (Tim44 family)
VGYIVLVLTILAALAICGVSVISGTAIESASQQFGLNSSGTGFFGGLVGGLLAGIFVILYGGLISLMLVAFGEGIYLLIGIEENTRRTTYLIENQNKIIPSEPQSITPSP